MLSETETRAGRGDECGGGMNAGRYSDMICSNVTGWVLARI